MIKVTCPTSYDIIGYMRADAYDTYVEKISEPYVNVYYTFSLYCDYVINTSTNTLVKARNPIESIFDSYCQIS
jgi:hypothetical protein